MEESEDSSWLAADDYHFYLIKMKGNGATGLQQLLRRVPLPVIYAIILFVIPFLLMLFFLPGIAVTMLPLLFNQD